MDTYSYVGELAAVGTAICWTMTSIFFMTAGRMVGSPVVNRIRLIFALVIVSGLHFIIEGQFLPIDAEPFRWGWLGLSGLIGFVIGDALLFQAFVMIGARLSTLMMSMVPVFSVLLGWTLLHEVLALQELLGVGLVVGGVMWVITDRHAENNVIPEGHNQRYYVIGILFGLGGAVGQASGLIASKLGLEGNFSPISGNLIRLTVATIAIWTFTLLHGSLYPGFQKLHDSPRALYWILFGAIAGPFIGVSLSLVAVQHAPVGIASTLMTLTPIILLPISRFYFKEIIGWRAILGTVLAVAGTAVIFLH